jgi:hypothetical protein
MTQHALNRRDALRKIAAGSVGVATSSLWVESLTAFAREQAVHAHATVAADLQAAAAWAPKVLNAHQLATAATLSELIIPQTETPGAKSALVDRFIDSVLQDAQPADRNRFISGLAWTDARSKALFGTDFISSSSAQQTDLLTRLSIDGSKEAPAGVDFFKAIKSMTITGYYSSEIGLSQELGDDGRLMLAEFTGCTHSEHQR